MGNENNSLFFHRRLSSVSGTEPRNIGENLVEEFLFAA